MDKLKVGLVGFGWFGRKHFNVLMNIPYVEVTAIADIRIKDILSRYGKSFQYSSYNQDVDELYGLENVNFYNSVEELIAHENIDVIDIVTDEENHYPVAKYALEKGKDIIVEKPLTTRYEHALKLKEIARKNDCKIYVGHILRFDPRMRFIKYIISKGKIGDIRYISFKRNFSRDAFLVYGRTHPFLSAMIHDIDLALWFTGKKVVNAYGHVKYSLGHSSPDILIAILEHEGNILVRMENTWHVAKTCPYGFESEVVVYGDRATVRQTNVPVIEVWSITGVEYPDMFLWPNIDGKIEGALKYELEHFVEHIRKGEESPIIPLDDAIEAVRVAELLVASSK